jgi:hypothetical protein
MKTLFRTTDGYRFEFDAATTTWTDGDLSFNCDDRLWPIDDDGEPVEGDIISAETGEVIPAFYIETKEGDTGEGPWTTYQAALRFAEAEVGVAWRIVGGPAERAEVDVFADDDDARTTWNTKRLEMVWMANRLGASLYLMRCFDKDQLAFEYVYVDEEIATEAGREWLLVGDDDSKATIRKIKIGDSLSFEAEKIITHESEA